MHRIAMLSVHGCPFTRLGEKDTGGMNVYVLQTARHLGRLGMGVDVYTRYHDPNDRQVDELEDDVRLIHVKAGPYDNSKESLHHHVPEFLANLRSFLKSDGARYDLVYSHYWLSASAGSTLSEEWAVPHVATFHTTAKTKLESRPDEVESPTRIELEETVAAQLNAIVVSTDKEKDDLVRLYGAPGDRINVVPAGVDLDAFRPMDQEKAREKLGISDSRVILSVGRIEPLKGLDLLITAVAKMRDLDGTRVVIVGGDLEHDPEVNELRQLASDLGVAEAVTFTGAKPQNELPDYYNAADVLVMPSYYESFGLVALEAMACGTPVIASRVGGPSSFIDHEVNGYLIPWRLPDVYAEKLDLILSDSALRERLGAEAKAKAQTMGWGEVAARMEDVFSRIIEEPWERVSGA